VRERDAAVSAPVRCETDQAIAEPKLVAVCLRYVDDFRLRNGSVSCLEVVGPAEELDQLSDRVRFAGVAVIGEPSPVSCSELPRVALVQVREDRARPTEEPAVLRLQDRDLVCPCDLAQLGTLAGPRLDLARDEIEPQLCQDLPHRRGRTGTTPTGRA
jgi:hypothetical protein